MNIEKRTKNQYEKQKHILHLLCLYYSGNNCENKCAKRFEILKEQNATKSDIISGNRNTKNNKMLSEICISVLCNEADGKFHIKYEADFATKA